MIGGVGDVRPDPPPYRIRMRVLKRNARLAARGFESYEDFLASRTWKAIIERYNASDRPKTCICGSDVVEFHHLTYDRVGGDELVADLRVLCTPCHRMLHVLERRDGIGLDPSVLKDPARAAEYRAQLRPADIGPFAIRLAMFHDLPLTVRLRRLLSLPAEDRAVIASDLRAIRKLIRHATERHRPLSPLKFDRRLWRATDKLVDRRPRVLDVLLPAQRHLSKLRDAA